MSSWYWLSWDASSLRSSSELEKFVDVAIIIDQPIKVIKTLKQAINRIAPQGHMTAQHSLLVKACLRAKNYKAALSVLESPVITIEPSKSGVESVDIRLYYYYGGMIYTGLKQYKKAQECFYNIISFPAYITSEIMVEAYKKFILVSLLTEGEVPSISRFASHTFIRQVKNWCAPYEELATSYGLHSVEDLKKCVSQHAEIFVKDKNFGLVKQVLKALYKKKISLN